MALFPKPAERGSKALERYLGRSPFLHRVQAAPLMIERQMVDLQVKYEPAHWEERGGTDSGALAMAVDLAASVLAEISVPDGRSWYIVSTTLECEVPTERPIKMLRVTALREDMDWHSSGEKSVLISVNRMATDKLVASARVYVVVV